MLSLLDEAGPPHSRLASTDLLGGLLPDDSDVNARIVSSSMACGCAADVAAGAQWKPLGYVWLILLSRYVATPGPVIISLDIHGCNIAAASFQHSPVWKASSIREEAS